MSTHRRLALIITLIVAVPATYTHAQSLDNPDDAAWLSGFGAAGMGRGGSVGYVANDILYVFGQSIPTTETSDAGRALFGTWDGEAWGGRDVFGRVDQSESINDAVIVGSDIYVAGSFSDIDGNGTAYIARWDGTQWNSLGTGLNGRVNALATDGIGNVYVGGQFTEAGGEPARNIARWNGSSWSPLPNPGGANNGVGGAVLDIAVGNSRVYVAGFFTEAGSEAAVSVASWNPSTSEWSGLGGGIRHSGFPSAIGFGGIGTSGGQVFVAGDFDLAANDGGEITVGNVAVFDGTQWSALGSGSLSSVSALLVTSGGRVFASGEFVAGQNHGVAEWTGGAWVQLAWDQYKWPVLDLVEYRGQPVAISEGFVSGAAYGTRMTNGIATWDGTEWDGLGAGVGEFGFDTWFVNAVFEHDGALFAGGLFDRAGDTMLRNFARFDGDRWDDLGSGLADGTRIHAFASTPSGLVVGGKFSQIGGVSSPSVALWNGTSWQPMGGGLTDFTIFDGVKQLDYVGGTLYAAGTFLTSGSTNARGLARWTGSSWEAVGGGVSEIMAMATDGSEFFVGGIGSELRAQFDPGTNQFTTTTGNVAHWDGTQWNDLEGVCCGPSVFTTGVRAMAMQGSDLIVGGDFLQAGSTPAKNIARWNGSTWEAIGDGIDGVVTALLVNGADIYAGGTFTTASGTTVNSVAKWDGTGWTSLGSGLYLSLTFQAVPSVNSLTVTSDGLAIGGRFSFSGQTPALNLAVWTDFSPVTGVEIEEMEIPSSFALGQNYPNPFNPSTTITFDLSERSAVKLTVFDLLGRTMDVVEPGTMSAGRHEMLFDASDLPSGIYLYRLQAGDFVVDTRRMVLVR